jgi:electron transfer flavoprotein beta subunit
MNIAVLAKQVPDLVEGLEINTQGKAIDPDSVRYILSEYDDHALEEALVLKERSGGRVEVFSIDIGEAKEALMTALAKGADRAVMISTGLESTPDNHTAARIFASLLGKQTPEARPDGANLDLILTGVRAISDLDGSLGGLLAGLLDLPYVGLVRKVEVSDGPGKVVVQKEYPGGFAAEIEVKLPAVLGIQAAQQPPRYVPIVRLRQVMKTAKVEEIVITPRAVQPLEVDRMFKPEEGQGAQMLAGDAGEIARQIAGLLSERNLLR